jgi:RNA polymerase sigma factor (sigma-70 family)
LAQAQSTAHARLHYGVRWKEGFDALRHRNLRLGTIAIFVYVGAEVAIGSFLINYIAQADIGNMAQAQAANYVAFYWGGAMVGRFIGAALMQKIAPRSLLATAAAVDVLLLLTTMLSHGQLAMWSVVAIGLFNSIMFPTIFTLGIDRLGPLTGKASSLLIMAIVGAIVPLVLGRTADLTSLKTALIVPAFCYAVICAFGVFARRPHPALAAQPRPSPPRDTPGAAPYIAQMTLETDLSAEFLSQSATAAPDWDAVYAEQLPKVYNFFRYRLRDDAVAQDLTATTFEKAWRSRDSYRRDLAGFATWLLAIARNVATDHLRGRRVHAPLEDAEEISASGTPEEDNARASDGERARCSQLPDRERELISLKYGAGRRTARSRSSRA